MMQRLILVFKSVFLNYGLSHNPKIMTEIYYLLWRLLIEVKILPSIEGIFNLIKSQGEN